MITEQDNTFLRRALRLAMNGRGHVEPNPMVGCVLVKNGQIIAEGWHKKYGEAHAEPTALNDCRERGNDPTGATAYVTLEPCCHTNKKTPPCAPRLIEAKIARVVIGCLDPNPDVNGKGVAMLREAGIEVDLAPAALAIEFQQLIAPFIVAQMPDLNERCYVTAKWAETKDGRVSGPAKSRMQISNDSSMRQVHLLRSRCDAIGVGIGTVLADDPQLTVRGVPEIRTSSRFIIDRNLRTPSGARLIQAAATGARVRLFCSEEAFRTSPSRVELESKCVDCFPVTGIEDSEFLLQPFIHSYTGRDGPTHVLVEPGPKLAESLLNWVDRLWVFRCQAESPEGLKAPRIPNHFLPVATLNLAGDILTEYLNTQSPAFFAPVPSADFVLAQEDVARATSP